MRIAKTFARTLLFVAGLTVLLIAAGAVAHFFWAMFGIGWELAQPDGWEGW